jgi:hypothetical protein
MEESVATATIPNFSVRLSLLRVRPCFSYAADEDVLVPPPPGEAVDRVRQRVLVAGHAIRGGLSAAKVPGECAAGIGLPAAEAPQLDGVSNVFHS